MGGPRGCVVQASHLEHETTGSACPMRMSGVSSCMRRPQHLVHRKPSLNVPHDDDDGDATESEKRKKGEHKRACTR